MKRLIALVYFFTILIGCSTEDNPVGRYVLRTSSGDLALEIKQGGIYKIQALESIAETVAIEGRWEFNEPPAPTMSLHGVVWRGTEPEPGHGIWAATIEQDSKICLDGEGINCFVKD